jgi:hypothetical protein
MDTPPPIIAKRPARPWPVLGAMTLFLPALGTGLWVFFEHQPGLRNELNGYAGMFIYIALLLLSAALIFAAIACGVASLVRRERWPGLAILGLLLNLATALWLRR